jgi:ATP-binding cassette subfamily A (ABC1) protein 3
LIRFVGFTNVVNILKCIAVPQFTGGVEKEFSAFAMAPPREHASLLDNAAPGTSPYHDPAGPGFSNPSTVSQFAASVARTVLLKTRKPLGCAVETLLPIAFVLLLAALSTLGSKVPVPAKLFVPPPPEPPIQDLAMAIRDAACVDTNSGTSAVDMTLLKYLPNCGNAPIASQLRCGGEWTSKLSPHLCINNTGFLGPLQNFEIMKALPSMDVMLITHAVAIEVLGRPSYLIPQPSVTKSLRSFGQIYVAPDTAVGQAFVNRMRTAPGFELFNASFGGFLTSRDEAFKYFVTEAGAGKAMALVTVDQYDNSGLSVTISMNKTCVPWTNQNQDRFAHGAGDDYKLYWTSGFLSLQRTILDAFNDDQLVTVNGINASVTDAFKTAGNAAAIVAMPYAEYVNDTFLSLAGSLAPLALALAFLYGVSQVAGRLVQEKEAKLREAMAAMGVDKLTLYLAWLTTFFLQYGIVAIGCTIALKVSFMPKSDGSVIFVLFLGFCLTVPTLGSVLSSFFSKSRTAAIATPILFFACSIPSFALGDSASKQTIEGLLILSPTAFAQGLKLALQYEMNNGIGWGDIANANDEVTLGTCLVMLYIDLAIYALLTWYLDNVLGGDWGVRQHPCFCFLNRCLKHPPMPTDQELGGADGGPRTISGASEPYPSGTPAVTIARVTKEFGSGEDKKVAVNDVSLKIYPGMVTAVLGHNGAGKTTLFNMLTGMLPVSKGDCFIYDYSIVSESSSARRNIGMCPQHNILWDDLTCYEHLHYFAWVKGVPFGQCKKAAEEMLKDVDLEEKRNARSASLSGGQKRKLSIGIAFIGGSRLVLLDEPTAGMDVHTRRYTWDLVQRMARDGGRAIILTTHFMDEAELLGDRVAMMAAGQLHSYGSTTYLKSTLGQSYTLNIQYTGVPTEDTRKEALRIVRQFVRNGKEKDSRGREQAIILPMDDVARFADMLRQLEEDATKTRLHIATFSMTAATIEDVFVKIAEGGHDVRTAEDATRASLIAPSEASAISISETHTHGGLGTGSPNANLAAKMLSGDNANGTPNPLRQFAGLMRKRFNCAHRDKRTLVLQIVMPVLVILLAMALAGGGPPGTPPVSVNAKILPDAQELIIGGGCPSYFVAAAERSVQVVQPANGTSSYTTAEFMLNTYKQHGNKGRTAGIQCLDASQRFDGSSNPTTVLFSNSTAFRHAAPFSIFAWYQARTNALRAAVGQDPLAAYTVISAPLPLTNREDSKIDGLSNAIIAILIIVPFSFVPSTYTGFIVRERSSKAKLLQFVSGVGYFVYWASNVLFDFVSFLITELLAVIIFAAFRRDEYTGDGKTTGTLIFLIAMYGVAAIPTSYVMSLPFTNHSTAQNAVLGIFFLAGFGLTMTGYLLQLMKGPVGLLYLFRLFPPACLGEGLIVMANAPSQRQLGVDVNLMAMDQLGWPLLYLAIVAVVMSAIVLFVDHPERTKRQQMLSYSTHQKAPPIIGEPADVAAERAEVEGPPKRDGDESFLRVVGLRKEYPAPAGATVSTNVAVQNLTFHVPKGEIFGLLGTNGAGKTTTMNVITGETLPTMGCATVAGHDCVTDAGESRRVIGYCPQFDALHDLMTVEEHLNFYCSLRGVNNTENVVSALITALGLGEYRRYMSKKLSGGNKRKLSVAIALIGAPRLLLLDEPTAGMDPLARRGLCEVVAAISAHCAVVLTTHHLEEVEALADRAAIMVGGKMACLGTLEHLKETLGEGYQVSVRVDDESRGQRIEQRLQRAYPGCVKLVEHHQTKLNFTVKNGPSTSLSSLFGLLHDMKTSRDTQDSFGVIDYTVSQSSVEEVFLAVAGGGTPHTVVETGPVATSGQKYVLLPPEPQTAVPPYRSTPNDMSPLDQL